MVKPTFFVRLSALWSDIPGGGLEMADRQGRCHAQAKLAPALVQSEYQTSVSKGWTTLMRRLYGCSRL